MAGDQTDVRLFPPPPRIISPVGERWTLIPAADILVLNQLPFFPTRRNRLSPHTHSYPSSTLLDPWGVVASFMPNSPPKNLSDPNTRSCHGPKTGLPPHICRSTPPTPSSATDGPLAGYVLMVALSPGLAVDFKNLPFAGCPVATPAHTPSNRSQRSLPLPPWRLGGYGPRATGPAWGRAAYKLRQTSHGHPPQ